MDKYLGVRLTFFCVNYIYTGLLVEANEAFATLENALIVYETGDFSNPEWRTAQRLPNRVHVMMCNVESFMVLK